ncbi:hypothetical protein [Mycoplasma struthionis]|nr:hypothetical protein [Mycoplasma struthionis]TPI02904.1 hypothetical protein FJM01_00225 [Mycoplasma struthionis]
MNNTKKLLLSSGAIFSATIASALTLSWVNNNQDKLVNSPNALLDYLNKQKFSYDREGNLGGLT